MIQIGLSLHNVLGWKEQTYFFVLGILCLSVGLIISIIDLVWPHRFSTILEVRRILTVPFLWRNLYSFAIFQVYYDTPYDRHVILEESHDVRYRKRNSKGLEDPPGLGSRILRYSYFLNERNKT